MKLCHLQKKNGWNMLNEISQTEKATCHMFWSYVESRPKMMVIMTVITVHEGKGGLPGGRGIKNQQEIGRCQGDWLGQKARPYLQNNHNKKKDGGMAQAV
jgi:hypothetical protein